MAQSLFLGLKNKQMKAAIAPAPDKIVIHSQTLDLAAVLFQPAERSAAGVHECPF
jgi:hypothetical protein